MYEQVNHAPHECWRSSCYSQLSDHCNKSDEIKHSNESGAFLSFKRSLVFWPHIGAVYRAGCWWEPPPPPWPLWLSGAPTGRSRRARPPPQPGSRPLQPHISAYWSLAARWRARKCSHRTWEEPFGNGGMCSAAAAAASLHAGNQRKVHLHHSNWFILSSLVFDIKKYRKSKLQQRLDCSLDGNAPGFDWPKAAVGVPSRPPLICFYLVFSLFILKLFSSSWYILQIYVW